jgi:hypothetical protein
MNNVDHRSLLRTGASRADAIRRETLS